MLNARTTARGLVVSALPAALMRLAVIAVAACAIALTLLLSATPVGAAEGDTVLTVSVEGESHSYSIADLRALGERHVRTSTIWTEGQQDFIGVSLDVLLASVGVSAGTVEAAAVNDYAVEIPLEDATANGPIIAYERNGATMSLRDKGPLWVIYPYDSDTAYRTEQIYSRSIWQLNRLTVK